MVATVSGMVCVLAELQVARPSYRQSQPFNAQLTPIGDMVGSLPTLRQVGERAHQRMHMSICGAGSLVGADPCRTSPQDRSKEPTQQGA